jgi:uncharacterized coiled-coil DUF342 family protein
MIKNALIERDELRDEVKDLKEAAKNHREELRDVESEANKLRQTNSTLTKTVDTLVQQNSELTGKDVDRRVQVAEAELKGVTETVGKFLKNTIYREAKQHQVADEHTYVQTQYVNGQQVPVPTPAKTHRQVEDTTERTTE